MFGYRDSSIFLPLCSAEKKKINSFLKQLERELMMTQFLFWSELILKYPSLCSFHFFGGKNFTHFYDLDFRNRLPNKNHA